MRQIKYVGLKAAAAQVSATTTATSLKDLLQTADSSLTDEMLRSISYVRLDAEGAVRWNIGGNPTSSVGQRLQDNTPEEFVGVHPEDIILIVAASTVAVNVLIGEVVK